MGGFSFLVSLRLHRVMMAWAGSTTLSVSCIPERGGCVLLRLCVIRKKKGEWGSHSPDWRDEKCVSARKRVTLFSQTTIDC